MTLEFFWSELRIERKKKKEKKSKSTKQNEEDKATGSALWLLSAEDRGANFGTLVWPCERWAHGAA